MSKVIDRYIVKEVVSIITVCGWMNENEFSVFIKNGLIVITHIEDHPFSQGRGMERFNSQMIKRGISMPYVFVPIPKK